MVFFNGNEQGVWRNTADTRSNLTMGYAYDPQNRLVEALDYQQNLQGTEVNHTDAFSL